MRNIYRLNSKLCFTAVTVFLLATPKNAYAHITTAFDYYIGAVFITLSTVGAAYIKRFFGPPALEREDYQNRLFGAATGEYLCVVVSLIIGRIIANPKHSSLGMSILYYSIPIYIVLAIFPNLLLYQKEGEKYLKTATNISNIIIAAMISIWTPIVLIFIGALVGAIRF